MDKMLGKHTYWRIHFLETDEWEVLGSMWADRKDAWDYRNNAVIEYPDIQFRVIRMETTTLIEEEAP